MPQYGSLVCIKIEVFGTVDIGSTQEMAFLLKTASC